MPLPLSDYASLIEPTWLAIIFWVRGAGWHNMLHLVTPLAPPDYSLPQMTES